VRNFQILIVSAVKICKRFSFRGLCSLAQPKAIYWGFVPGSYWETDPLGYSPLRK